MTALRRERQPVLPSLFQTGPGGPPADKDFDAFLNFMSDPARHPPAAASHTPGPAKSALPSLTRSGTGTGGAASASAVPDPIDATTLPPDPLDPAHYATVVARNRYLAGKYDPSSTIDQTENLVTGAICPTRPVC